MSHVSILLLYEPPTAKGRPLPLVRVQDPDLIRRVAEAGLLQARARAESLGQADELLGEVEECEVQRLESILALLVGKPESRQNPVRTM